MNILILGSEGFIGGNAVKYFNSCGYKVVGADILIKDADNYLLINPEIPSFSGIFVNKSFDVCINATGAANVQFSYTHPGADYTLNVSNVYNILDSIREYNPDCKFINLSSAAVYGNPIALPINEHSPCNPLSPYGFHKMYSEQICREFFFFYGIKTLSARIFSAYGEGLKKQIFWDLYHKIKVAKDEISLFGTGKETRDFIYIHDLMDALHCMILNAEFNGDVINVASGKETKIMDAVGSFIQIFGKPIRVDFRSENKKGDPLYWQSDISKLSSLGFKAKTPLDTGLKNYIEWLRN